MIRKIHDVEERGEERSVHIDGRDALTRDMDVLVMIQVFASVAVHCGVQGRALSSLDPAPPVALTTRAPES